MDNCLKFVVTLALLTCTTTARSWHGIHPHHQPLHKHHGFERPTNWYGDSQEWDFPKNGNSNYPWKYFGDYYGDASWEKVPSNNGWVRPDHDHHSLGHGNSFNQYPKWNGDFWVFPEEDVKFSTPRAPTTTTPTTTTSSELNVLSCIRSCPVTSEFNPVCGTNNVTYSNMGRLECAKNCGVDVQFQRELACSLPPNNTPNPSNTNDDIVATTPTTPSDSDVNNNSTNAPIDSEIKPTRYTTIDLNILSTNKPALDDSQTGLNNNSGVTIPQDVLASIFTISPSTNDAPELSFDPRIKEQQSSTTTVVN